MTAAPGTKGATSLACALASLCFSLAAQAALDIGEVAPDFTAQAALAGSVYRFSLAESLKKGPVVLYFFPAAYSEGCSVEAHYFADATGEFNALGASVVGVSGDDIETLS
jgi:peroxiredoxin Q/BCP